VGDGEFENQLRALVHDLGLTDRVRFLGSLAETQVARVLVEHDVMVLASFGSFETTAIAVREAMAVGLPVIMSRVGEAENMIEPYGNGILVGQKNIDDLVAAIRWFSMHRDDIPRMGLKSFEKARLEYASDRSPVRLISAIQESLHNG
jgi:colanic acid/amylovoran biosynthesis glycosyltransferase